MPDILNIKSVLKLNNLKINIGNEVISCAIKIFAFFFFFLKVLTME